MEGVQSLRLDFAAAQEARLRELITEWLMTTNTTDPMVNHLAACEKRKSTTGKWFLSGTVYNTWKSKGPSLLWLHGIR